MSVGKIFSRAREDNVLSTVLIELTYACNLDCSFCYNDLGLTGRRLSLDDYMALLDELAAMRVLYLTFSGGEPLLYRHFYELGAHARKRGFVTRVKTNGLPLTRRNAERLKIEVDPFLVEMSLHGARPETHDRLTQVPGSFDRLLRNIREIRDLGLRLRLNSTLTRLNEGEVEEMAALSDSLGVPLQFDPEVTPRDNGDLSPLELAPTAKGIERMYRLTARRARAARNSDRIPLRIKSNEQAADAPTTEKHKLCGAGSTNLVVDPFGNVYPCVQFRRSVGNLHERTVRDIWHGSEELVQVRRLAGQALKVLRANGLNHLCMGVNELRTGDPLTPPASKLETDRIFERVHFEEGQRGDNSA